MVEAFNYRLEQASLLVLDLVMRSIPAASRGTIHLLDEDGERLVPQASSGGTEVISKLQMRVGQGIAGLVVRNAEATYVPDVLEDPSFLRYGPPPSFRSLLAAPLITGGRAIGCISITSDRANAFALGDRVTLDRLAKQAATAIKNAQPPATQATAAIKNAQLPGQAWPERVAGGVAEGFIAQMEDIERILTQLQSKTQATSVLLADTSGQLISHVGMTGNVESVVFSALAAGNVSATGEMARQVGEREGFDLVFLEGKEHNVYLSNVGKAFLLAVTFSKYVQIGLVRLFTGKAVEELMRLTEELEAESAQALMGVDFPDALAEGMEEAFGGILTEGIGEGFGGALADELERAFGGMDFGG